VSRAGRRLWIAALSVAAAGALGMAALGLRGAGAPARCPEGTLALGARCCAPGQHLRDDRCEGVPHSCPPGLSPRTPAGGEGPPSVRGSEGPPSANVACIAAPHLIRIPPGRLVVGPGDWEAQGVVTPRTIELTSPFWIRSHEVTVQGWNACVDAGVCAPRMDDEPGRPVRNIKFSQADAYCRWSGGTVPSDDEWFFAAAGTQARRYPWGDTGAVCQRSGWGAASGPCAHGNGPDWAGIHPGDVTPEGVRDMGGSVSEWVVRSDGRPAVRGGSWRSSFAAELRTWHVRDQDPSRGADDIGVRCRYQQVAPSIRP